MPDTGKDEEKEIRTNSVDIVAESSQSLSFKTCPTCPGPNRTPTLHADQCMPVDSTEADKDADADVVDNKVNAASSSSSKPAEEQDKSVTCDYPFCTLRQQLLLEESRKERPVVIGEGVDVTAEGNARIVLSNQGPSTPVLKGKRKAEDAEDEPVSPAKKNQKPAISEADKEAKYKVAYQEHWKDHISKIFRDLPDQPGTSSGLGLCMLTLHESTASSSNLDGTQYDPTDIPIDIEPERAFETFVWPPILTLRFASFQFDTLNHEGGRILSSFMDERHARDHEGGGLEGLDILHLAEANGEEPSFIDDQEHQQFERLTDI